MVIRPESVPCWRWGDASSQCVVIVIERGNDGGGVIQMAGLAELEACAMGKGVDKSPELSSAGERVRTEC